VVFTNELPFLGRIKRWNIYSKYNACLNFIEDNEVLSREHFLIKNEILSFSENEHSKMENGHMPFYLKLRFIKT